MESFTLIQKTTIYFGKGHELSIGQKILPYGSSCLLVHDGGAYLGPLLAAIKASLKDSGIRWYELSGIEANPKVSKADEGAALCRKEAVSFVLGIGGGSVMDTAKYISYAVHCPGNPLCLTPDKKVSHKVLPHGAVVTLSGTSSECSCCAMIVNDRENPVIKYALSHTALYFDFSIVNPELTYSLPEKQLASGAMDAISHALEVYLGVSEEEPLMERYMEGVIRTVLQYGPMAKKEPRNYKIRSVLSLAVMMAYRDDLSNGGILQDWGCHGIENAVTAISNGTHGTVLGILTPSYLRFVFRKNPRPFVQFSVRCMDVCPVGKSPEEIVEEGAKRLEEWLIIMGLPTHLKEIGLSAGELMKCAEISAPAGAVYQLAKEEIMEIYRMAQ